jgi:hypothetical protein
VREFLDRGYGFRREIIGAQSVQMCALLFICQAAATFDVLATPCHTLGMVVSYTIVPRGRGYWIEASDNFGTRRPIERYDTEDRAVRRLRELQGSAALAERKTDPLVHKKRH